MDGKESRRLMSWIEPKKAHKRMVTRLLQVNAHVDPLLPRRAEGRHDRRPRQAREEEVRREALADGADGWIPIAEKNLPYELTASFLLMADRRVCRTRSSSRSS
jgi:hypothetical protein